MSPSLEKDRIAVILGGPDLEVAWRAALESWETAHPQERASAYTFITGLRDHFLAVYQDVNDFEEREVIGAVFYILVKSHWILLNTQAGYQMAEGRLNESVPCRAGLLSALLGVLEPLLKSFDLERITEFLAQPTGFMDGDPVGMSFSGGKADNLVIDARVSALQERVRKFELDQRNLKEELGHCDPEAIIAMFHHLESKTHSAYDLVSRREREDYLKPDAPDSVLQETTPASNHEEVTALQAEVSRLQEALQAAQWQQQAVEWQKEELQTRYQRVVVAATSGDSSAIVLLEELEELRDDRRRLQKEIGVASADGVLALLAAKEQKLAEFAELSALLNSMESSLTSL